MSRILHWGVAVLLLGFQGLLLLGKDAPETSRDSFDALLREGSRLAEAQKYEEATEFFERAFALSHTTPVSPDVMFALTNNLARCAAASGRYLTAKKFYEKAINAVGDSDKPEHLAVVAGNLGALSLRAGELSKAAGYLRLCLEVRRKTGVAAPPETLSNMGTVLQILGKPGDAEVLYRRALSRLGQDAGSAVREQLQRNLIASLIAQGRYSEAIALSEALTASIEMSSPAALRDYVYLLWLYALAGRIEEVRTGLKVLQTAIPKAVRPHALDGLLAMVHAEVLLAEDRPRESAVAFSAAATGFSATPFAEVNTDPLLQRSHASSVLNAATAWHRAGSARNTLAWLENSYAAERRRLAFLGLSALEDSEDLRLVETSLRSEEAYERLRWRMAAEAFSTGAGEAQHIRLGPARAAIEEQQKFEASKKALRARAPELWSAIFSDRLNVHPDELDQLASALPAGTAFLEVAVLEESLVFLLATRHSTPKCITLRIADSEVASAAELRALVQRARFILSRSSSQPQALAVCKRLYETLFRPVEEVVENGSPDLLLLAPVGYLRYVPFAALHDGERFLVQKYAIGNVTGLDLIRLGKANSRLAGRPSFVGFGNPDGSLPASGTECRNIADLFGDARLMLGSAASVQDFIGLCGSQTFVHVATHGVLAPDNPADSYLLFANDERLTYSEMMGLPNLGELRLLTLSGCLTASTTDGDGAEMAGMAYQFTKKSRAGAVVATLWPVVDKSTADLMLDFYRRMLSHHVQMGTLGRAQSLACAQRAMLASHSTAHPFYWAPYILLGDYR